MKLGILTPGNYFWSTGILSSFLDNAPTYLNFLSASFGLHGANVDNALHMQVILGLKTITDSGLPNPLHSGSFEITANSWKFIQAISVGAVFFGACTYIGNGPNFMVKSISEHLAVKTPSFFGYILKYTLPILLPLFFLVWLLFFN
jgi:Na+/H+ antiporter NhaD/arsenite permease-like protein